jgi:hypothetical protein
MATTYYNDIQKLYVAYFNRPADPAGLAYWETVVEGAKGSTAAVSASFAASAEYKAAYANMTNTQVVTAVYQNLFGHAPDAAGLKYWADLLDAKTTTIDAVVTNIAGGAQGTDLIAYNAKVTAAAAFTTAIDTDAEKAGYTGDAANKIAKTFLAGVTDSVSLASATSPSTLNGTVATAVAAGTTFSVAGALAQINTATKALNAFVTATVTKDSNGDTFKDALDITDVQTKAVATVATDLGGTAGSLFSASTTSQSVRDALVAAQQATLSGNLTKAQGVVATDNANIAKVAGLGDAVSILAAAQTSLKAAQSVDVTAQADLTAKEASFGINNGVGGVASSAVTLKGTDASGTLVYTPAGGAETTLATVVNGKATLATGLSASDYVGLTELIASYNAHTTTSANVLKAADNVKFAQLGANMLDVAADATGTITVGGTGPDAGAHTEAEVVAAITKAVKANGTTVADGAIPTVSQIQTTLQVLSTKTDATSIAAYNNLNELVKAEAGVGVAAADVNKFNPLLTTLATDTKTVSDTSDAIAKLAKDVAALQTANANANTLAGLTATVNAYNTALKDKGYAVTTLDAAHQTNFATAASDIYVVSNKDASIAAFGLQGTDSLFVGTGYTLVQGSLTATTPVKGNDAALEIFVSSTAGGDTQLQIETHAYSSAVTGTGTGEIVTITLTGVDASTIKLDSTGIITAGTAAA